MQVNDPVGATAPSATPKDEVSPVGDAAENPARARPARRFRNALERGQTEACAAASDAITGAAIAGWFRAESSAGRPSTATAVTSAPRAVDRILIGADREGAQARIRIGAGALAGTEIQLSSGGAGHIVEARLLTHAATSRHTLSSVMDEIRLRLRQRGIILATRASAARLLVRAADDGRLDCRRVRTTETDR